MISSLLIYKINHNNADGVMCENMRNATMTIEYLARNERGTRFCGYERTVRINRFDIFSSVGRS